MKKVFLWMLTLLLLSCSNGGNPDSPIEENAPKYVFLFIGDGMGVNTVNFTEMYLKALEGGPGYKHLGMTQFPVVSMATTYSNDHEITDSAASGTAIATGCKTNNAFLGLDPDGNTLENISEIAKRNGVKVGILSTVTINEATPAAFYAHQPDREDYDPIIQDIAKSQYEFYAGNGYSIKSSPTNVFTTDSKTGATVRDEYLKKSGFVIAHNKAEYEAGRSADRMVMLPEISFRLDYEVSTPERKARKMLMKDVVEYAIDFLTKDGGEEGFFLMAESGQIDSYGHGNDAAALVNEIVDFDEAIAVAYRFYQQFPKETIIVVTADHDTGGISVIGRNAESLVNLKYQNMAQTRITAELRSLMQSQEEVVSWEQTKSLLDQHLGLWSKMDISEEDEAIIRDEYDRTVALRDEGHVVDPYAYADNAKIVKVAVEVFDRLCGAGWSSSDHTAGFVPVFAVGPGTEIFNGMNDNTDIFKKIIQITNYE